MNIYVGNLNALVTENHLRNLFMQYGAVKDIKIVANDYTGRSQGFGFVEIEEARQAERAINNLNNINFMNRFIEVTKAV
ncbi:RNA recognition motif domain-containing protein [Chitinophagaceae bacterium MMS25-I14]